MTYYNIIILHLSSILCSCNLGTIVDITERPGQLWLSQGNEHENIKVLSQIYWCINI